MSDLINLTPTNKVILINEFGDAMRLIEIIGESIDFFGYLSVSEYLKLIGNLSDHCMDHVYGWDEEDLGKFNILELDPDHYTMEVPKPHVLSYRPDKDHNILDFITSDYDKKYRFNDNLPKNYIDWRHHE